jgi:aspartate/methionine/tyrosine aminotransferase
MRNLESEEYFAKYYYSKPYFICLSDCESISISELIDLGGGSVEEFLKIKLVYPEMPGSASFRKEIASLYEAVNEDQVLVLGAPVEGIYLTMNTLLEKGDHVILLSPAFDPLFNVAEHLTNNVSRWFLKKKGNTWELDFDQLETLLKKPTKLLIINFPHNPTGFHPSRAELNRIVEMASRHGVRIFSDEMYKGLEYKPIDRLPTLPDIAENSVALGGASKALGLAGLRLGWLVTKDPVLYKKLFELKNYTSMCSTQAGEYLGQMAIRATPKLVERNLKIVKQNLVVAEGVFQKWKRHIEWIRPMAGSVSAVKLNHKSAEAFCHKMAERYGVVLLPLRFMGFEDQYARVGFGRTDFAVCMKVFDEALGEIFNEK